MKTALKLSDEIMEVSYIFGTPDDAIGKVEEYVKAGCGHFVINLWFSPSELKEISKLFAVKVIPYFKH